MVGGLTSRHKNYRMVTLSEDGKTKSRYVHRIVAEAFIPNPNNLPQINHIDGDSHNNNVENLEWCTAQENQNHAYTTGLHKSTECILCGNKIFHSGYNICKECRTAILVQANSILIAKSKVDLANSIIKNLKLTEQEKEIFQLRANGKTYEEIAKLLGRTRQNVGLIAKSCARECLETDWSKK